VRETWRAPERHAPRLQQPVRAPSIVGAFVYSHSGEYGAAARDVRIPGLALDLEFIRSYRSGLAHGIGELSCGCTCTLAQQLGPSGVPDMQPEPGTTPATGGGRT
jgi:uncharacterized protein DUF6531